MTTYTGITKTIGGRVWALCDQLPVGGVGETKEDALRDMLNGVKVFLEYLPDDLSPVNLAAAERDELTEEFSIEA